MIGAVRIILTFQRNSIAVFVRIPVFVVTVAVQPIACIYLDPGLGCF